MKITEVILYLIDMRMKHPFETSFGTLQDKTIIIVQAKDQSGVIGWGEGVAFDAPWYTEETVKTSLHMLEDFLIPIIMHRELEHPNEVSKLFASIRRNNMAKSAIEGAVWDIYAQQTNQSLAKAVGGTRKEIDVGISIGIQPSIERLLNTIDSYLQEGYKRIKVKIKPGWDLDVIHAIRDCFGNIPLMADANSAYTLDDIDTLKQLDSYGLMMIEQPLAHDDIVDHALLQKQLKTPICLDESITSFEDARRAIGLGSCQIINIKIGRVGGITEAIKIHDYCAENSIPVWCGGMLEAGIGRAHNIALTSLSNFIMPGDTAGSSRYWYEDIITPEVVVKDGIIEIPHKIGLGYTVKDSYIEQKARRKIVIR